MKLHKITDGFYHYVKYDYSIGGAHKERTIFVGDDGEWYIRHVGEIINVKDLKRRFGRVNFESYKILG